MTLFVRPSGLSGLPIVGAISADEWLLHTIIGLSFGLVLFLVASGFTLTLGLSRFVNLAHGATFMVGAHVATTVAADGHAFPSVLLAATVAGAAVSLLVYALLSTRWRVISGDGLRQVLFSFGCLLIIADLVRARWEGIPRSMTPPPAFAGLVDIGDSSFPVYRFFVMGMALVVAAGIWWLQERTKFGALVRAGADDKEQLEAMGVRPQLLSLAVFALSGALAGLAGGLAAPILGASVGQEFSILIFALVAVVVGGLGSLGGAFIASILVGLADAYGKAALPSFASFTMMALVIVVLAVRPGGLIVRGSVS